MKKIINFIGYSCSGKTTISNMIFEQNPTCFFLAYDKIKWQLSGYQRDEHRGIISEIERKFLLALLAEEKISFIISDLRFRNEDDFQNFLEIHKIPKENFINIYLKAPLEIRLKRWKERIERCEKIGHKVSITTEELFLRQAAEEIYIPKDAIEFDTSIQSKEEIYNTKKIQEEVLKLRPKGPGGQKSKEDSLPDQNDISSSIAEGGS